MTIRITGMNSGLDTESIITELVSAQSAKKNSLVKAQTKLSWKMDAWKTLNSKIYSFYTGTVSNLRFSAAYAKKKTTVSNSAVASVIAGANATDGVQTLKVNKLAKSGYLTGAELKKANGSLASYTSATKLKDIEGMQLDAEGKISLTLKTGDKSTDINLSGDSTIADLTKQLKDAGVSASFDENYQRFFISSTTTGKNADFSLTANNQNGFKALSAMGINVLDDVTKSEYTRFANMSDSDKAAYIDEQVQTKTEAANAAITAAEKTITDNQKLYDEFFEKNVDPDFVKSELQTSEQIAKFKETLTAHRDSLKEAPEGETDEEKTAREEKLKEAEARLKSVDTLAGYVSKMEAAQQTKADNEALVADDSAAIRDQVTQDVEQRITMAQAALASSDYSAKATRIQGQDAEIELNNATFTSATNSFTINDMTITALVESQETVTLTTSNDYDGIYDTIKQFIKGYNELINEMDKLYNADSSKGYEPLTSDEKKEMSDSEIEDWEKKIKESLLRRDSSLNDISSAMEEAMGAGFTVGDKTYYLSDFGINTLGYFTAAENEKHAYHINGDKDDSATAGKTDSLKTMITNDPQTVVDFFQQLSNSLYTKMTEKMSANSMRSIYKAYNDKQMKQEYDEYTSDIAEQEEKLTALQDKWYQKFSAMETALAKLSSKTSAIAGLLG
ncbi:flagellar filament capping protein FliD [Kineothrix sp. MSJ-39]|uniref:flagellar filament capping protein FliD n=1 Tax=Kineothrix sp. MSJ-39 TaxID=2841533 RepID=UPI001C1163B1|nr:flagellar filament capping protein FliD [Kineothrix sp. MSJ-39]MBU5429488.1 flagellar filament capping protein FliD [Kineothrix sp. MSJ-39]